MISVLVILFCGNMNLDWGPLTYLLDIFRWGGAVGGKIFLKKE